MTARDYLDALRERWHALVECMATAAARRLQPRIARQLQNERPEIHAARQRVHYLVLLAELAKMRRFPETEDQKR